MKVLLTYFKTTGKYYSSGSYETDLVNTFEINAEVNGFMRDGILPDLAPGAREFIVSVSIPERYGSPPQLIFPYGSAEFLEQQVKRGNELAVLLSDLIGQRDRLLAEKNEQLLPTNERLKEVERKLADQLDHNKKLTEQMFDAARHQDNNKFLREENEKLRKERDEALSLELTRRCHDAERDLLEARQKYDIIILNSQKKDKTKVADDHMIKILRESESELKDKLSKLEKVFADTSDKLNESTHRELILRDRFNKLLNLTLNAIPEDKSRAIIDEVENDG